MPYFFICPIYVLLVLGLLALAVGVRFTDKYRNYSGHIIFGVIGTFPGFVLGNVIFWALFVGSVLLLKKAPIDFSGDVTKTAAALGLAGLFLGGLALANVVGCLGGFLVGFLFRSRTKKKLNQDGTI
jgi:hypothetical protein